MALEAFLADDDDDCYHGPTSAGLTPAPPPSVAVPDDEALEALQLQADATSGATAGGGIRAAMAAADVVVMNAVDGLDALAAHIDALHLLDVERIRPGWDHYFMVMADLAARRSNCMKRRVGAVLVRDRRVIATGYNGTARFVKRLDDAGQEAEAGAGKGVGRAQRRAWEGMRRGLAWTCLDETATGPDLLLCCEHAGAHATATRAAAPGATAMPAAATAWSSACACTPKKTP